MYEAMLLWWLAQDYVGTEADYIFMSFAEHPHRYKFLELEKNDTDDET
jgi:hypothetical protein